MMIEYIEIDNEFAALTIEPVGGDGSIEFMVDADNSELGQTVTLSKAQAQVLISDLVSMISTYP